MNTINNETFEKEYYTEDNKKLIQFAYRKYRKYLTLEELEDCGTDGLLNAIKYYDKNRGKFSTLLVNCVISRCKYKLDKKYKDKNAEYTYKHNNSRHYIDKQLTKMEDREVIENLIKILHPRLQKIIKYKFIEEKTYEEIGYIMGFSAQNIYQLTQNALSTLRKRTRCIS